MRKPILLFRLLHTGAYRKADPFLMRLLVQDAILRPLHIALLLWLITGGILLAIEVWRLL